MRETSPQALVTVILPKLDISEALKLENTQTSFNVGNYRGSISSYKFYIGYA